MLKKLIIHWLGIVGMGENQNHSRRRRKKELVDVDGCSSSRWMELYYGNAVRVVYSGGREELYRSNIPASYLLDKYSHMCVARPDVFKNPHESVLSREETLSVGQKYIMIELTKLDKLRRKHHAPSPKEEEELRVRNEEEEEEEEGGCGGRRTVAPPVDGGGCESELEWFGSAKQFYSSKGTETWSQSLLRKCRGGGGGAKKPFVPPIQKPRMNENWEPSLTSITEISP